jgi:putative molybdopterin biosynthesis protein
MNGRGVHLQYSFESAGQRGATLHNPLFNLLCALRDHGSIRHAASAMGASYRHVWGQVKHWEAVLGEPLVTWKQGQATRLTEFAQRLLWAETRARTRLTPQIEALRSELERVLSDALDGSQHVLTVFASHDLALPALRDIASRMVRLHIDLRFAGSVDALHALAAGRCLVAGFHVPPLRGAAPLFADAMKRLLAPGRHKLIGCLRRTQGLMVAPGNPLAIRGLPDLARVGVRFVNRQPGSGTRLLMDHLLQTQGIAPADIPGWDDAPEDSHVAVAAAVASGAGHVGPGVEAASRRFGLDFVPLTVEDYFLVCLKDSLDHPAVIKLRQALESPEWRAELATLPGYSAAEHVGEVLSLTRALPWWNFRSVKPGHR